MANPMRRKLKNVINQYTDAQVKVREATSNDPWGPSSTLMSEVADLSYNVVAFSEVMQMIWKRLNDSGKNWRHVYKALVLLEYILKTGSEKVAQQCRENIYAIQTLRDFQHVEDNKDQGINVREKAKQLVILLKDEEKLKQERAKALKAKERFAQSSTGISSTGGMQQSASMTFTRQHTGGSAPSLSGAGAYSDPTLDGATGRRLSTSDLEQARPSTAGEEELQLQLALAISKEEADADTQKKRGDDVRLALALQESSKKSGDETLVDILGDVQPVSAHNNHDDDFWAGGGATAAAASTRTGNDPWAPPTAPPQDAFAPQANNDPWAPALPTRPDPWASSQISSVATTPAQNDPWATERPVQDDDDFDALMGRSATSPPTVMNDALDMSEFSSDPSANTKHDLTDRQRTKTPQDFLGANSSLVDIDNLVTGTKPAGTNPFAPGAAPSNPFMAQQTPQVRPTLNQMQYQQRAQFTQPPSGALVNPLLPNANQPPMMPAQSHNPFM